MISLILCPLIKAGATFQWLLLCTYKVLTNARIIFEITHVLNFLADSRAGISKPFPVLSQGTLHQK